MGNGEDEGGSPAQTDTAALGATDSSVCLSLSGLRMHESADRGYVTLVRNLTGDDHPTITPRLS